MQFHVRTAFQTVIVVFCAVLVLVHVTPDIYAQSADSTSTQRINFDEITADADKPLYLRFGLFGGATLNQHSMNFNDFAEFQGAPRTGGKIGDVSAFSYHFGALFEFPIADRFGVALRASYTNVGIPTQSTRTRENLLTAPLPGTTTPYVLGIDHTLNFGSLSLVAGEPYLTYRILDALTLYAGARIGYFLDANVRAAESISDTSDVRYVPLPGTDNGGLRNVFSGVIPQINRINIGLIGGFSYEIPLDPNGKFLAALEAFYTFGGLSQVANGLVLNSPRDSNIYGQPVTRTVPNIELGTDRDPQSNAWPRVQKPGTWSFNNIRAGVSFRYSPFRTIRPEMSPAMLETIKQLKKLDSSIAVERVQNAKRLAQVDSINTAIGKKVEELKKVGISLNITKVVGIDESGGEIPKPKLVVEQFRKSAYQPLLPAVFFDESSYTFPSRYRRVKSADRAGFKIEEVAGKGNLEVYRQILNIIGKRMEDNPAAVLFLTGCNANTGAEQGNQKLSEQRAQAVSDYLQDAWKMPTKRLIIQKRDLPENPASSATPTGAAENRRVDISSNIVEILAPVGSDQVARVANPPTLRFSLEINAGAGLKQWNMEVTQFADDEVATIKQIGGTNTYPPQVDWNLEKEPNTIPTSGQDLTVQLTMTDINNRNGDAPLVAVPVEQIPVQKKEAENRPDKRIDLYEVLNFLGTGAPILDEVNTKTLEMLKTKLRPEARVIVSAFTDNTGDAAKSKEIAQQRAEFVAKAIGVPGARINAVGPTTMYDNQTPEGRAYNRLVRVEVQTPTR
jgi:outer membrane protein OmpA-like peptidoglycan-associated protein